MSKGVKIGKKIAEKYDGIQCDSHNIGIPIQITTEQERQWDKKYGPIKSDDEEWQDKLMKKHAHIQPSLLPLPLQQYTPEFIRRMTSQYQGTPIELSYSNMYTFTNKRRILHGRGMNCRIRTRKNIRK